MDYENAWPKAAYVAYNTVAGVLRETAFVSWKREQEEEARACLAAAAAFEASGGDHPVAVAMVEVMLTPLLAELEREDEAAQDSPAASP